MQFDFGQLDTQSRYKLLSFTIVPRPIAWVTTVGRDGRRNAAPFSFFNVMTTDPPILSVGFTARVPGGKDTIRQVEETGQFVVNLVPYPLLDAMNVTGAEFAPEIDELDEAGLAALPSTRVAPPRIAGSPVAFECERFRVIAFDSGQCILLGRVLLAHIADEAVLDPARCHIDTRRLDLVGRMDNRYLRTDQVFERPRILASEWLGSDRAAAQGRGH